MLGQNGGRLEAPQTRVGEHGRDTRLTLQAAARPTLEGWARSQTRPHRPGQRARLLLALAQGQTLAAVAAAVGVTEDTVAAWRDRYLEAGLDGLQDRPRRGCPPTDTEADRQALWQKRQADPPDGHTRWSLRLRARTTGISTGHLPRWWSAAGSQPHRVRTFKLSDDPQCEAKLRDVLAVYAQKGLPTS